MGLVSVPLWPFPRKGRLWIMGLGRFHRPNNLIHHEKWLWHVFIQQSICFHVLLTRVHTLLKSTSVLACVQTLRWRSGRVRIKLLYESIF